jgi:hypothetical protein
MSIDEMKLYHQAAQQKFKTNIMNKVTRQVQIVKPDATDEGVDPVMRSEGGRGQPLKEPDLAGGVNNQNNPSKGCGQISRCVDSREFCGGIASIIFGFCPTHGTTGRIVGPNKPEIMS